MKPNQYFDFSRFVQLIRMEGANNYRWILFVSLGVFVFLTIIALVMASDHDFRDFHKIWFAIVVLGGGFLFTSVCCSELDTKPSRMNYLMVPASGFEKFLVKLLLSGPVYLIGVITIYWIFTKLVSALSGYYFNFQFDSFAPFSEFGWLIIKLYLVLQSVFLVGAIAFNRFSVVKTILSLNVLSIILGIIGFIFFRIIFWKYFNGFFSVDGGVPPPDENFINFVEYSLWPAIQKIFWFGLAPLLWVVGYFKIKEREA